MFKVKDIATKMVITARPEMPIYDAIRLMANRNITGLPVVDAELNLVGVLSERDVLKLLYETTEAVITTMSYSGMLCRPMVEDNRKVHFLMPSLMPLAASRNSEVNFPKPQLPVSDPDVHGW